MTVLDPRPTPGGTRVLPARASIETLPVLMLAPHSSCNCKCVMCDIWKDRRGLDVSVAQLKELLPDLERLGVRRVCLTGGEPLMHAEIEEVCGVLCGAGVGITMLSTGLLLERHASWLGASVDDLVVSLDGPSAIHDDIRRVRRAFELLARGVAVVRSTFPSTRITARCTVQAANAHALCDTVEAAHLLGLDGISFLAADVTSGAFGRVAAPASPLASVLVTSRHLPALRHSIDLLEERHATDFATGFIREPAGKLRERLVTHFEALAGERSFPQASCNAPWVSAVVEVDGTVRPCFFLPPIGNAFTDGGVAHVLNGPLARHFRASHDVGRHPVCQRCVCRLNLTDGDHV